MSQAEPGGTLVLAFTNQKGGVGKTTTALNLGACLAEVGARVLLIDLDPQGNASTGVGVDRSKVAVGTYEVLSGTSIRDGIHPTEVDRLSVLPSTIDLAGAEVELVSAFARETKLRQAIQPVRGAYDFVLIDSPPSLGLLAVNALAAADQVMVPIQCEYYALEGLGQLLRTLELVRDGLNPDLAVGGVVLTMFDARTKLSEQVVGEVRRYFGETVFRTVIPRSIRLSEAPGYGKPIILYESSSRAANAYRWLAEEVLARWPIAAKAQPSIFDPDALAASAREIAPSEVPVSDEPGRVGEPDAPAPAAVGEPAPPDGGDLRPVTAEHGAFATEAMLDDAGAPTVTDPVVDDAALGVTAEPAAMDLASAAPDEGRKPQADDGVVPAPGEPSDEASPYGAWEPVDER